MAIDKQVWAKKQETRQRIIKLCPSINDNSGIYFFTRTDENGIRYAYVGQAKHLLSRCAQHLLGYQHIDLSIKKHGLYNDKNEYGYKLDYVNLPESQLDAYEREYIQKYASWGFQLRNATLGGQDSGKQVIDSKTPKGYHDGLKQGYENARKEIKELFTKYLMVSVKSQEDTFKKDGTIKEVYQRKYNEFIEWLKGGEENEEKN